MRTVSSSITFAAGFSLLLLSPTFGWATSFKFTKIADTSTIIPGDTAPFAEFRGHPAIDGMTVIFNGDAGGSPIGGTGGIYSGSGGPLSLIANTNTPQSRSPRRDRGSPLETLSARKTTTRARYRGGVPSPIPVGDPGNSPPRSEASQPGSSADDARCSPPRDVEPRNYPYHWS